MILPSKPDTRPPGKVLPAPSHVVNDVPPAYSTEIHSPRNGPCYDPPKIIGETALPAPGPHVSDHGRH
jgi:hypothetical protein